MTNASGTAVSGPTAFPTVPAVGMDHLTMWAERRHFPSQFQGQSYWKGESKENCFLYLHSFIHSELKPTEVWILPNMKTFLRARTNWTRFLSKRWRAVTSVDTNGHMTTWKWDFMVVCVHGPGVFIGKIDHGLLTPPVHKKAGAHFIHDVSTFITYGIPNTLPPNNITLEPTHVRVGDARVKFRDY